MVGGILNTDTSVIQEHMAMQASKNLDHPKRRGVELTDKAKAKTAYRLQNRKDSFFHLQNNIVWKELEKSEIRQRFWGERRREEDERLREEQWRNMTEEE